MKRLLVAATVLAAASYVGCASPKSASIIVHTPRVNAHLFECVSLAELERRVAEQKTESAREKEANARGEVYLAPFLAPAPPSEEQLAQIRVQFHRGDEIWSFHSIDSGWVIVREGAVVFQYLTDHEY